MSLSQKIF